MLMSSEVGGVFSVACSPWLVELTAADECSELAVVDVVGKDGDRAAGEALALASSAAR